MTPCTHTYAIFDPDGNLHWMPNKPVSDKQTGLTAFIETFDPPMRLAKAVDFSNRGYECRPVTVCDRERLEALIESVKKLEAEMHEHEQSFSERSQGAVDMACSAVVIKYHALIDSTITERSEEEHE